MLIKIPIFYDNRKASLLYSIQYHDFDPPDRFGQ